MEDSTVLHVTQMGSELVYFDDPLSEFIPVAEKEGEWCRLVPADEIERALHEPIRWCDSETNPHPELEWTWDHSRAKRVMEGKE